jgi:DNA-directed RNA polymerase subunit H
MLLYYSIMSTMNTSSLTSQIYTSRKVLLELLKKQKYDTTNSEHFSINEINTMKTNNQLDMYLTENSDPEDENKRLKHIYVKYFLDKSLRPQIIMETIDDLFVTSEMLTTNDTLIIVVNNEPNDKLNEFTRDTWEREKIHIILFPLKRLQFNILNHIFVPEHRILSEAEKIAIKTKYNITDDDKFPKLPRTDPVAKAIGIRPGEVCEIIRPSKTAIKAPYFRICE